MFQPSLAEPAVSEMALPPPDLGDTPSAPSAAPATETLAQAPLAAAPAEPEPAPQPEPEPAIAPPQAPEPSTPETPTPETPRPETTPLEAPLKQPEPRAETRLAGAPTRPKREAQTPAPKVPRPSNPRRPAAKPSREAPDTSPERGRNDARAAGPQALPTGTPSGPAASSPGSAAQAEAAYLAELQRAIARHQHFPDDARRRQRTGVVTLSFLVQGDGSIRQIRLAKSSGDTALDEAALQAMQRLNRFKPIPATIGRQEWAMRVPIRFDLR